MNSPNNLVKDKNLTVNLQNELVDFMVSGARLCDAMTDSIREDESPKYLTEEDLKSLNKRKAINLFLKLDIEEQQLHGELLKLKHNIDPLKAMDQLADRVEEMTERKKKLEVEVISLEKKSSYLKNEMKRDKNTLMAQKAEILQNSEIQEFRAWKANKDKRTAPLTVKPFEKLAPTVVKAQSSYTAGGEGSAK